MSNELNDDIIKPFNKIQKAGPLHPDEIIHPAMRVKKEVPLDVADIQHMEQFAYPISPLFHSLPQDVVPYEPVRELFPGTKQSIAEQLIATYMITNKSLAWQYSDPYREKKRREQLQTTPYAHQLNDLFVSQLRFIGVRPESFDRWLVDTYMHMTKEERDAVGEGSIDLIPRMEDQ